MMTVTRPRRRTLPIDSIAVESFETSSGPIARVDPAEGSIEGLTCAVNTQWVCGTGRGVCPACNG
ncbi:MAG TPA: hypothetical protein VFR81_15075 [Longimicrobium sp.]|nr:hypothetical protein [Longimicrobium sp.]